MIRGEVLENATLYGLAAVGVMKGIGELASNEVRRTAERRSIRPSHIAWGVLAAEVIAYDTFAPDNETLTEGAHDGLDQHKTAITLGIAITALHLRRWLPQAVDPYHQGGKRARAWRQRKAAA